ncbi:MAG: TIGR02117 family protein [Burkholderiales bacterium]|nr:TIGR02117 family protein [Burkholderiales bacterium]
MNQRKIIWTWIRRISLSFILFILVYLLSAVILSRTIVHSDFRPIPANQAGIDIYVRTNGVHTDLILPAQSSERDWYQIIPPADLHRTEDNTVGQTEYISFGWGDKGFYLDTPTWADLKFSTAFIAATGLGSTAMHIEAVTTPQVSESVRKIRISPAQLQKLIAHIDQSFEYDAQGKIIKINTTANYNDHDAFYEAIGHYSIFTTCNQWTRDGLSEAGIRTSAFAPLDDGVMRPLGEIVP